MSFTGGINFNPEKNNFEIIKKNLCTRSDNIEIIAEENYFFIFNILDKDISYFKLGNVSVFASSRLLNKKDLIHKNSLEGIYTDAELIHRLYLLNKNFTPKDFIGNFCFIIIDEKIKKQICFTDQIGHSDLFFSKIKHSMFYSSGIDELMFIQDSIEINEDRVLEYLIFSMQIENGTFYKNIYKLNRSEFLIANENDHEIRKYFFLTNPQTLILKDDREYAEAFEELFSEVIYQHLDEGNPTSIALSGGLDSSSITSIAAKKFKNKKIIASNFSFVNLPKDELNKTDEKEYSDLVLEKYPKLIKNNVQISNEGPIKYLHDNHHLYEEPITAVNIYLLDSLLKKASMLGAKVHLEGFDGDSVVSHGNERLYDLGRRFRVFELLREAKMLKRNKKQNISTLNILKEYFLKQIIPRSFKELIRSNKTDLLKIKMRRINSKLISDEWLKNKLSKVNDLKIYEQRDSRNFHLLTLQHPIWSNAISSMNKAGLVNGVKVRNPFFDLRMLNFCLSLPNAQKLNNGMDRFVFRNAMKDITPLK